MSKVWSQRGHLRAVREPGVSHDETALVHRSYAEGIQWEISRGRHAASGPRNERRSVMVTSRAAAMSQMRARLAER